MTKAIKLPDDWYGCDKDCLHIPDFKPQDVYSIHKIRFQQLCSDRVHYANSYSVVLDVRIGQNENTAKWVSIESKRVRTLEARDALYIQIIRAVYEALTNEGEPNDN